MKNPMTASPAGMKAARNNLAMFCSVRMAYTTNGIEGGTRMPSVPPAASVPGRERARVAVLAHLRQRHLAHGGGGRERGPADRAEGGAGTHRGHRHAAAVVAEQRVGATEQPRRQSRPRGHVAHQQEQRDYREGIAGEGLERRGLEKAQERPEALDPYEAAGADRQHRHTDRHAQREQEKENQKADEPAAKFDMGALVLPGWSRTDGAVRADLHDAARHRIGRHDHEQPGERQRHGVRPALRDAQHHGRVVVAELLRRAVPELQGECEASSTRNSRLAARSNMDRQRTGRSLVKAPTSTLARLSWQSGRNANTATAQPSCTSRYRRDPRDPRAEHLRQAASDHRHARDQHDGNKQQAAQHRHGARRRASSSARRGTVRRRRCLVYVLGPRASFTWSTSPPGPARP